MPTLFFPQRETLGLVLASAGIPSAVSHAPAAAGYDDQGRLWLTTSVWLPRETLITLTRFGVQIVGFSGPPAAKTVCCWQELLLLEPSSNLSGHFSGAVIFELPARQLATLAAEIERFGQRPWSYRWLAHADDATGSDRLLLKTVAPPHYTLLRALDDCHSEDGIHAYLEQAPGVWIEAGWRHPLAAQIQPPPGKCIRLRPSSVWKWIDELPFSGAADEISFACASGLRQCEPETQAKDTVPFRRQLNIPLRLMPDDDDSAAELWIVADGASAWLNRFVKSFDEKLLRPFTFAVSADSDKPIVLLRIRSSKEPPPVLVDLPAGFKPVLKLGNLFIPCGSRLTPLPRRDALRRLLAGDPKRLTWLRPLDNDAFRPESLPAAAFQPLAAWVDYRIEIAESSHSAWQQSSFGAFDRFVVERPATAAPILPETKVAPPLAAPEEEQVEEAKSPAKQGFFARALSLFTGGSKRSVNASQAAEEQHRRMPFGEAIQNALRLPSERTLEPQKFEQAFERTKTLESRFLSMLTKLTAEERRKLWPEMASAYMQANNPDESAVCWLNALWEEPKFSPLWTWGWLKAEAVQAGWDPAAAKIAEWLASPPTAARARTVAAYAVWAAGQDVAPAGFRENLNQLQRYLNDRESDLPVRAAWLARTALVRTTRGDVLALAHTRDRVFQRMIANGLSLDIDAPAFIRFAESGDPDRFGRVRTWLSGKRERIKSWIESLAPAPSGGEPIRLRLDQFGLSPEISCTAAYADLMLAWGLSRLGEKDKAASVRNEAWAALDDRDPIHSFLKAGFDYRIRQSRDGKVVGGPLPPELLARLNDLSVDDRYRVDRFRQHSRILDPTEHINAYWASTMRHFRHGDQLRKHLIDLPALDPAALNERVGQLLARATGESAAALPDILLGVLDVTARLEPGLADKVLEAVRPALDLVSGTSSKQLKLLERGLLAAASCDRPAHVQALAQRFVQYVKNQQGLPAATRLEGLTSQTFRCFHRLGMKNEAYEILKQIDDLLTGGEKLNSLEKKRSKDWPDLLRTLLPVAAAYYYSGQQTAGFNIIDKAGTDLYSASMSLADRTALSLVYASTLGQVPVGIALGRFGDLFNRLKEVAVNGWNTHYTLQPLQLIDTIVLAVVSEDFILGPTIRAWLDDEEYLIRQRIHKELKEMMAEQGV